MYGYEWTGQNGIYRLSVNSKIEKEIRPVFKEELDYFGFNEHWTYPDTDAPLLWAEGIRRYILNGTCVAEAMGGGFYTKPTIKIYTEGLNLEPIDVDALWKENERLMLGLEKTSMDFIRKTHDKYEKQGMAFAVAFSGGKDSLVLLDLVSRTLSPDEFSVVFSNTGMELSTTIQSVEKAKKHWPSLKFYEAKSHLKPTDSWEEFGPPGRRMRWCCAVHKSVPTILLLRELTGNYNIKVVVFDGVRAEESAARADRDEISVGAKNIKTVNYNSPAADFDARIDAQLNKVAYNRNKVRIQELWKKQSGYDSITLWCANYAVPIQWVVSDEVLPHIIVLKTVQDGKIADNTALHNATQFFETHCQRSEGQSIYCQLLYLPDWRKLS